MLESKFEALMILIKNTQRKFKIDQKDIASKLQKMLDALNYSDFDLSLWFTTNKTIQFYNKNYRQKDKPTDILSFPYHDYLKAGDRIKAKSEEEKNLGDLIISLEYLDKDAPNWNQTFLERLDILLAHGIAHLLNYDHQTEEEYEQMQKVEKKLLKSIS